MFEPIAFCGLDCSKCPAYIATQNNDDALREKTASEWSQLSHAELKPEDITCDGCHSDGARLFSHCLECNIRACGAAKAVSNCGLCDDYACERISAFMQDVPGVKETLDKAVERKNK